MNFIPVEKLPEREPKRPYRRWNDYFAEFMRMNIKYARVDFSGSDYVSLASAYDSARNFANNSEYPVRVSRIGEEIYLIRTDMGPVDA